VGVRNEQDQHKKDKLANAILVDLIVYGAWLRKLKIMMYINII
jgi:hypothetical protein